MRIVRNYVRSDLGRRRVLHPCKGAFEPQGLRNQAHTISLRGGEISSRYDRKPSLVFGIYVERFQVSGKAENGYERCRY